MQRLVFFGMDGGFSAVALTRLAGSGLRPELVVLGLDRALELRGPVLDHLRARTGWLSRGKSPPPPTDAAVVDKDLARLARSLGIDVLRTTDANAARAQAIIRSARPDALVVAGFPHLLAPAVLGLASRGGLNVHPGKLPEERGPSPLFWALREGRTRIHFTVHLLDAGEDSGDVLASGELELTPGTEGEEILTDCAERAARELIRSVRGLLAGELVRTPQPSAQAGRKPRPSFRDGRLDPSKSALEVYTFVAGCARSHSLFLEVAGDRFFIARAESFDPAATLAFEYVLTGDRLILRCSPGVVELVLKENGALFSTDHDER